MRKLTGLVTAAAAAAALVLPLVAASGASAATHPARTSVARAGAVTAGNIVFVRKGNLWLLASGKQTQLTTNGGDSWPRWSPDGLYVIFIHKGDVWLTIPSPPVGLEQITHVGDISGAPSWSPNDEFIAYWTGDFESGQLNILRVERGNNAVHVGAPRVVARSPGRAKARRGGARPAAAQTLSPLADSTSLAWSPDGTQIAFNGGTCLGIFDDCLSTVTLATGEEQTLSAWSGDGMEERGFSTVPEWSADSTRVYFTTQHFRDDDSLTPTTIMSVTPRGRTLNRTAAQNNDRIGTPDPAGGNTLLVTAGHNHQEWVVRVAGNGARTYLAQGDEQDWQPVPASG